MVAGSEAAPSLCAPLPCGAELLVSSESLGREEGGGGEREKKERKAAVMAGGDGLDENPTELLAGFISSSLPSPKGLQGAWELLGVASSVPGCSKHPGPARRGLKMGFIGHPGV